LKQARRLWARLRGARNLPHAKVPLTSSVSGKCREERPGRASCDSCACRHRINSLACTRAASHRAKPEIAAKRLLKTCDEFRERSAPSSFPKSLRKTSALLSPFFEDGFVKTVVELIRRALR
jgi:hypothetical protein